MHGAGRDDSRGGDGIGTGQGGLFAGLVERDRSCVVNEIDKIDDPIGEILARIEALKEQLEELRSENNDLKIRLFAGLCIECGEKVHSQYYYPQWHCSRCGKSFDQVVQR